MDYKPNVIVVMADDAGIGDMEIYNEESKIPTPNINSIGKDGHMFLKSYSPGSVCTQTRYGLLTGKYHFRTSYRGKGVVFDYSEPLINENDGIQRHLKREGYRTYCAGKWHLGMNWAEEKSQESEGQFRNEIINFNEEIGDPSEQGFDKYYGIRASHDMPPYCFIENGHVVGRPTSDKETYYNQQREGPESPVWNDYDVGKRITQKALSYITEASQSDEPFFLYVPTSSPHRPCLPPSFIEGRSDAGRRGDMVSQFDWTVGAIREQLSSLGIEDETLLIATSDHGPKFRDDTNHDPVNGLRGGKATLFEGGIRVPLVIDPPRGVKFDNWVDEPVSLIDVAPTVLDLINVDYDSNDFDGVSWIGTTPEKRPLVYEDGGGNLAIKYGKWKYIRSSHTEMLYDIEDDPKEETDLSDHKTRVQNEMEDILESIIKDK